MLGMALTLVDKPMVIQNSGLFVLAVAVYCIALALLLAFCLVWIHEQLETIVEVESYDAFYSINVQSRFSEIVGRVQQSLAGNESQVAVLGFPAV